MPRDPHPLTLSSEDFTRPSLLLSPSQVLYYRHNYYSLPRLSHPLPISTTITARITTHIDTTSNISPTPLIPAAPPLRCLLHPPPFHYLRAHQAPATPDVHQQDPTRPASPGDRSDPQRGVWVCSGVDLHAGDGDTTKSFGNYSIILGCSILRQFF